MTLEVDRLIKSYRYGKTLVTAVRDVSLTLATGEVLAFLGPNGAGKTTTIKMIAGLIRPDSGRVQIAGIDPHRNPQALRFVGAVLEGNRNLYWRLTPEENLDYFGVLKGLTRHEVRRRSRDLLERFELTAKRRTSVQKLSRGMQQKLAIAVALMHQPKLLLLDEPTLGLDVEATQYVKGLVKAIAAEGCAILLTTHQLDIAEELSDRVAIIQKGEIIISTSTRDLIKQFSGTAYIIEIEGELDNLQIQKLQVLNAQVQAGKIVYMGSSELLYSVIEVLKPLPIIQVKKDSADLTEIFLKLVGEKHHV
ncbi:MAG: ABC transporter ATP-binding protein [Coleofasciculaceae cyanobacterium]